MKKSIRKLMSYYMPYKKVLFMDLFFAIASATIALTIPLIVRHTINNVINFEKELAIKQTIFSGIVILILLFVYFGCNYYITYYGHIMGAQIEKDMRLEVFKHYHKLSHSFYDEQKIGKLMSRITVDLNNIGEFLHHAPEEIIVSGGRIIGAIVIFSILNWKLALVSAVLFATIIIYMICFIPKLNEKIMKNHEQISEINAQIEDSLLGIYIAKSFANEDMEISKFSDSNANFVTAQKEAFKTAGKFYSVTIPFVAAIAPVVVIFGAFSVINDCMSASDLITFSLYASVMIAPIFGILFLLEQFQENVAGYRRFLEVLNTEPEIVDSENAVDLRGVDGNIEFKNVFFNYPNNKSIFNGLNLKINAGEYVAIVGASGVGKTTLCNLIPRFYEISKGQITIDGIDIRNIRIKDLRENIGYVHQDTFLFSGTVLENIQYGKPGATREEVVEAAKSSYAHEFIMNLPEGYETKVGQRGVKLSGGQKQRISIARVFLKNPPILIFDEATSSLDNESEKYIQQSMEKLAVNRTTLVIAHRLSTIKTAKRILVMEHGKIVEEGTHKELLDRDGVYAEFYKLL